MSFEEWSIKYIEDNDRPYFWEDECLEGLKAAWQAAKEQMEKENVELRELLWVFHMDHFRHLYGDDGERQCSLCQVDFKRDSVEDLRAGFARAGGR